MSILISATKIVYKVKIYDRKSVLFYSSFYDLGEYQQTLDGHTDEIFSCAFNYEGDTVITGSKDNTCRIWR